MENYICEICGDEFEDYEISDCIKCGRQYCDMCESFDEIGVCEICEEYYEEEE